MFNFSGLSLVKRLTVLVGGALLGLALLVAGILVSERVVLMGERQNAVRQNVETVHSLMAYYYGQFRQANSPRRKPASARWTTSGRCATAPTVISGSTTCTT